MNVSTLFEGAQIAIAALSLNGFAITAVKVPRQGAVGRKGRAV